MSHLNEIYKIPVKSKITEESLFKISLMKEVIKPTKPHRHANYHELIFLNQGSGFHEIDDTNFDVITPVAYYLRPGQTHCWNFSGIPKGYVLMFKEEFLLKEDIGLLYTLPAQVSLNDEVALFNLLSEFCKDFKAGHWDPEVYKAYLHLLIAKLKHVLGTKNDALPLPDHLFQRYKRLVNDSYHKNKQLNFYAEKLNITTAVLNDVCKKSVGKTASTIINERILLEAKILLSATGKPINEIANDLQFSDSSHFVKFFKVNTNFTPGNYRELAFLKK